MVGLVYHYILKKYLKNTNKISFVIVTHKVRKAFSCIFIYYIYVILNISYKIIGKTFQKMIFNLKRFHNFENNYWIDVIYYEIMPSDAFSSDKHQLSYQYTVSLTPNE